MLSLAGLVHQAQAQSASSGLWVGTVSLDQVTERNGSLTESGGNFQFRILFHVNASGAVSLLKDVMVIEYKVQENDTNNQPVTVTKLGLVSDPRKLPSYDLVSRSDGRTRGLRYSASAYDFEGFALSPAPVGSLALNQTLEFTLRASEDGPTNPYRHKFHPDHAKGRIYSRAVTINFKGGQQAETPSGTTRITGTYKEVVTGLVSYDIQMAGSIVLDRISNVTNLNP